MIKEDLRKFELNNAVLEDFDSLMEMHLDRIEEVVISEVDLNSKLLNILGLCINIKTLIISGDQRTNVNAILANICKPELLKNLILDNVKIPSNFSFKKLVNLRMISLNNIRFCNIKTGLDDIINPEKIEAINFEEVDFARNSLDIISRFKNLRYLNLTRVQNCILGNLQFLNQMEKLEKINIEDNIINFKELHDLLTAKFHKEIVGRLSSEHDNIVTNSIEIKENGFVSITVNGEDLEDLINEIQLYKVNSILIIDNGNCDLTKYIYNLKQVKGKVAIAIKDISCVNAKEAKDLKEKLSLEYINIIDFDGALQYEKNRFCYSIDKYIKIRKEIDLLMQDVDLEEDELTKFLEVYKILGSTIMYDDIMEDDVKSSNLENGILEKKCIDVGFAEILKNCLAIVGIESKIVRGKYNEDSEEHCWNQVKVLDAWYNVDLGLDSKRMTVSPKFKNKPAYCLISDREFSKMHVPSSSKREYCENTMNQKIVYQYLKGDGAIKRTVKSMLQKIRKIFAYNKQKALPSGENGEKVENKEDED